MIPMDAFLMNCNVRPFSYAHSELRSVTCWCVCVCVSNGKEKILCLQTDINNNQAVINPKSIPPFINQLIGWISEAT